MAGEAMTLDELRAIAEAAKARQPDITPAPWVRDERWGSLAIYADNGGVMVAGANWDEQLEIENPADAQLIIAAPNLNTAVITLWEMLQSAQAEIKSRDEADELWPYFYIPYDNGWEVWYETNRVCFGDADTLENAKIAAVAKIRELRGDNES